MKLKKKEAQPTIKKNELVEEEIIDRINSQIQISTMDNLNYQREDNGNLIHMSSLTNKSMAKSEVSSISKETLNNNSTNCKENDDSFIQKMSVNGLEFNLKSIRSACKTGETNQKEKNNKDEVKNEEFLFKNVQAPIVYFGKKTLINPMKPKKLEDSQSNVDVSKDTLNFQKKENNIIPNNKGNNVNVNPKLKRCECSVKSRVILLTTSIIALIALVLICVYLK